MAAPIVSADKLRESLRALLPPEALLLAAEDQQPYLIDHRRLYHGRALAVALPDSVAQVCALLAWCHERRVGVVPQGGNTGYCGGATADESGTQLVVALRRLNRIRAIEPANFSMTVEAGCVLANVQQAAAQADRFFPLHLGAEGSCQIGGNLATNAGGLNVLRFGMMRELVLGVEAVLPDGRLYEGLSALRKDNTGYHLASLLIGSEGTLAVLTAATLKLWPRMRSTSTAFIAIPDVDAAVRVLGLLRESCGERLNSFELLPRIAIELTVRHVPGVVDPFARPHQWYLLCELSSPEPEPLDELLGQVLTGATESGLILEALLATGERQRTAFWKLREEIPEAQRRAGASAKHDISVPVAAVPAFVRAGTAWLQGHVPEGTLVAYGHAGDGNLHFNISFMQGSGAEDAKRREPEVRRAIHDLVQSFGGSISAEHGIGRLKVGELARYASPVKLAAMRAIKNALDPHGIMNPGKVLSG
jgi:FAD/FMN-containing dehydrogenase